MMGETQGIEKQQKKTPRAVNPEAKVVDQIRFHWDIMS